MLRRLLTTSAAAIPSDSAAFAAFSVRTGISFKDPSILSEATTHKSYLIPSDASLRYNELGARLLKLYGFEHVISRYPNIPIDAANSLTQVYINSESLSQVGKSWGVQFIMKSKLVDGKTQLNTHAVRSWLVESLIGATYINNGSMKARSLVQKHILSRTVDYQVHLDLHLKLRLPKQMLARLAQKLQIEKPVARLLKETGRNSVEPVFIVGIYSGMQKIGEGYGSSIKMAETRAVKDALIKYYLEDLQKEECPGKDESDDDLTFFESNPEL